MIRLSIIVPVYNVEKYLARCLDSLYNQGLSLDEFEIIIVNDGSTDSSPEIAVEYAQHHSNLKIISQSNGGLSAARNTGLRNARGLYIWFVDSDDFAEPNTIHPLLEYAEKNKLDVECFNLQLYFENGNKQTYNINTKYEGTILTGEEFTVKVNMPPVAWTALYKNDFLKRNNLIFCEGILHEDQEFTPRAYYLADRICYKNIIVVNYFQREGSIMKSKNPRKCSSFITVCDSLFQFKLNNVTPGTKAWNMFDVKIAFALSQALAHYNDKCGVKLSEIKKRSWFPLVISPYSDKKTRRKVSLMNFSPRLYILIRKLFK